MTMAEILAVEALMFRSWRRITTEAAQQAFPSGRVARFMYHGETQEIRDVIYTQGMWLGS